MDDVLNLSQLVNQVQNGDTKAFGRIYDLLLDRVYRFIYFRVSSKEDAQDLAEEVFMKIWEGLKSYKDTGVPFEAWVFKIARNQVIDFYRTRKSNVSIDQLVEIEDRNPSVEELVDLNLNKARVLKALKKLPDSYREIISLKFIEDMENDEISLILDKPVDQVRVLQSRAINALRKVLKDE